MTANNCHHRKVRIRGKAGMFHAHCPDCNVRGPDYATVGEAHRHHKTDFLAVTGAQESAEKAQEAVGV